MQRILITGATGFIGSRLAARLSTTRDVRCLARSLERAKRLGDQGVAVYLGDVTTPDSLVPAMRGVDAVIHMAALLAGTAGDIHRVNVQGTENVARAAEQAGCRMVMVSSLAAAGPCKRESPKREGDPDAPVSNYGRSKRDAEAAARRFGAGLSLSIVRPPIVYGPGDAGTFEMFRPIRRLGMHLHPGFGSRFHSWVYVDDLIEGIIAVTERGEAASDAAGSGCYYFAGEEQPSYAEVGRMMGAAIGKQRVWVFRNGPLMVWGAATLNEMIGWWKGATPALNWDKAREALAGNWLCDATKARDQLGWRPKVRLQEGIALAVRWYREQGWL